MEDDWQTLALAWLPAVLMVMAMVVDMPTDMAVDAVMAVVIATVKVIAMATDWQCNSHNIGHAAEE